MINIRKGLVVELAKHKLEVLWKKIFQNFCFQMETRKRTSFFEYVFAFQALKKVGGIYRKLIFDQRGCFNLNF